jgi:uracil-DNA glycosylase
MTDISWTQLAEEIRSCTLCAARLPLGPRPVLAGSATARILIISQAPGTRAHHAGVPFADASGRRLRAWLGLDEATFYDAARVAIMPMGFCYPGKTAQGDKLPDPVCSRTWHQRMLTAMPNVELTVLVGGLAQRAYLPDFENVTAAVAQWRDLLPAVAPIPHPSWHNNLWLRTNPWFESEMLPVLQRRIGSVIGRAETKCPIPG